MYLTIRTDNPEAEIGLFDGKTELAYVVWQAHRELSNTIMRKIEDMILSSKKSPEDVKGIVCFEGPGSFTGLRIGLTVGNTMAYALDIPVVACGGEDWVQTGITRLLGGEKNTIVVPKYGSDAHITLPRK